MMKTIDERINAIERVLGHQIPGTQLTRVLAPVSGVEWCLSIGCLYCPKEFFKSSTIEGCVTLAEQFIEEFKLETEKVMKR